MAEIVGGVIGFISGLFFAYVSVAIITLFLSRRKAKSKETEEEERREEERRNKKVTNVVEMAKARIPSREISCQTEISGLDAKISGSRATTKIIESSPAKPKQSKTALDGNASPDSKASPSPSRSPSPSPQKHKARSPSPQTPKKQGARKRFSLPDIQGKWRTSSGKVCEIAAEVVTWEDGKVSKIIEEDAGLIMNGWRLMTMTARAVEWEKAGSKRTWTKVEAIADSGGQENADGGSQLKWDGEWSTSSGKTCTVVNCVVSFPGGQDVLIEWKNGEWLMGGWRCSQIHTYADRVAQVEWAKSGQIRTWSRVVPELPAEEGALPLPPWPTFAIVDPPWVNLSGKGKLIDPLTAIAELGILKPLIRIIHGPDKVSSVERSLLRAHPSGEQLLVQLLREGVCHCAQEIITNELRNAPLHDKDQKHAMPIAMDSGVGLLIEMLEWGSGVNKRSASSSTQAQRPAWLTGGEKGEDSREAVLQNNGTLYFFIESLGESSTMARDNAAAALRNLSQDSAASSHGIVGI